MSDAQTPDVQVRRDGSRYVATLDGEEVGAAYVREADGRTVVVLVVAGDGRGDGAERAVLAAAGADGHVA